MIDDAAGRGHVGDRLVAFPSKEVQAVTDTRQIGADEEIRLARTQRGVERLHVPLLHLDVLLVDEVHVVILDGRTALVLVGDELDLRAVGAHQVRKPPVRRCGSRRRRGPLAGHGLAAGRELIAVRHHLRRQRGDVRNREADVVERRAPGRARRRLHPQDEHGVGEPDGVLPADLLRRPAEGVHPELPVRLDARDVEMEMADDGGSFLVRELRAG